MPFHTLGASMCNDRTRLTASEATAAESIGWNQSSWDCWINHFKSLTWEDLIFVGVDFHYSALGWNALSWDGTKEAPPSAEKRWEELNENEQEHATELCYFQESWDKVDMTPNPGPFPFPKVKSRYAPWNELSDDDRQIAMDSLGYTQSTWNAYGTAEIEKKSYSELTQLQRSDAIRLGFYERTWDCFQNHYQSQKWASLEGNVHDALQVLGWDESSFDEKNPPLSYTNEWSRLSKEEQSVALVVCYFEDNWVGNKSIDTAQDNAEKDAIGQIEPIVDKQETDIALVGASKEINSANAVNEKGMLSVLSLLLATGFLF